MNNLFYRNSTSNDERNINNQNKPNNSKCKFNFFTMKKNTIASLYDVEYFLNNLTSVTKYFNFFKKLK